jgi:hypothetical protein
LIIKDAVSSSKLLLNAMIPPKAEVGSVLNAGLIGFL